jgi:hypothetical protein
MAFFLLNLIFYLLNALPLSIISHNVKIFFFEGRQIYRLNQVHHDHQYAIQIGSSHFRYSKSQLAFLSNRALKHFRHSELPFEINLPTQLGDQNRFELSDLISCFKAIDSLFRS